VEVKVRESATRWGEDEGEAVAEGRCGEGKREGEGEDEGGQ
jgi:hypothetical protein